MAAQHRARPSSRRSRKGTDEVLVLEQEHFPIVKSAHVVPVVFQQAWAVDRQVKVHVDGAAECVAVNVDDAGTRRRYYRRHRPDGAPIDDIEACLAYAEDKSSAALREIRATRRLTMKIKGALSQLLALQMLRGPLLHEAQAETVRRHVAEFPDERFGTAALRRAGGDASLARKQNLDALLDPTLVYTEMLERAPRVASILGHMRWHLLRFSGPLLAYSDHPVVVWPMRAARARPFARPQSGPLEAIEIRVPLSPDLALLLSWAPTQSPVAASHAGRWHAASLNAFTISQADRQWMHRPGGEPPVAEGDWPTPMTTALMPGYDEAQAAESWRRRRAVAVYVRDGDAPRRSTIDVLDDLTASTSSLAA